MIDVVLRQAGTHPRRYFGFLSLPGSRSVVWLRTRQDEAGPSTLTIIGYCGPIAPPWSPMEAPACGRPLG